MKKNETSKVLVVDDEPEARKLVRKYLKLEFANTEFNEAGDGKEALEIINSWKPNVVISDVNMPKMNGIELLRRVKETTPGTQFVVFTGRDDQDTPIKALRLGASDYLMKPLNMEELSLAVQRAIKRWNDETELENHRKRLETLVEKRTEGLLKLNESLLRERDLTKELETQIRHAQKMEAIGTLAGGIAHDFNNILSAIIGFTDLTMDYLEDGSKQKSNLQKVLKASDRAKNLVRQILTFSRNEESEPKPVQLSPVVKESVKLLRASIPATIELKYDIDPEAGTVLADPTQISQVLMNLCTNAAHAIDEKGGTLEISLAPVHVDEATAAANTRLSVGDYVMLRVKDTGVGMDEKTVERIFEPFFTTKGVGQGTGLGLSVVHGIVISHNGAITVKSSPGEGSEFCVYIPKIEDVEQDEEAEAPLPSEIPKGANERILIVDDEEALVEMWKEMLELLGYRVTAETHPVEALETFKNDPDGFDLVITDQTMPVMTGASLGAEITKIRPDIPMILLTGFSQMVTPEMAKAMGFKEFVIKPIVKKDLGEAAHKALTAAVNEKEG